MLTKQEQVLSLLDQYIHAHGLQILESKDIDHGRQLKLTDGTEKCTFNVYHTGKVVIGGKQSQLRQQLQEWANFRAVEMARHATTTDGSTAPAATQNHGTRYIVSAEKWDKIRTALGELGAEIVWEDHRVAHEVYHADIRSGAERVVVTQFQTGTLLVQGRNSDLFHEICRRLDVLLAQSPAEHATRYLSEDQASQLKPQMERPEAEEKAWLFLEDELGKDVLGFLLDHDRNTLIAGSVLLDAARELPMPDYSPLVMPFARAYEGFLIQVFIKLGLTDGRLIEESDIDAIKVGAWLDKLPTLLMHPKRDRHIESDLRSAWEGTRHLMIHSDPMRQMVLPTYEKARNEIAGVLMRAMSRGYEAFIGGKIPVRQPADNTDAPKREQAQSRRKSNESKGTQITVHDEAELQRILLEKGYEIESIRDANNPTKWQVKTKDLLLFFPREPGDELIVKSEQAEHFITWYQAQIARPKDVGQPDSSAYRAHIGADEAGKGDYYGPLVTAAVYVDATTEVELIRLGVRDSKAISDNVILDLAEKIRSRCLHAIELLPPTDYNQEYRKQPNMNVILAALHARAIRKAAQLSGAQEVLVDQFASAEVLENALSVPDGTIRLVQRPQAESDIAVAAASILARAAFVEAIYDLRAKSGMEIPFGSSSPEVISIGRAIVKRWGPASLERIAKVTFKTTREILKSG